MGSEHGLHVITGNYGGYSNNGKWLAGTIEMADHPRAGMLPDFGNFHIYGKIPYDPSPRMEELKPHVTGPSVKPNAYYEAKGKRPKSLKTKWGTVKQEKSIT